MFIFGPSNYVLRVALLDIEPTIWRRIEIPSELPLPAVARVLETAMGWGGYHLHHFDVAGVLFGDPSDDADYLIEERVATIAHLLPREGCELEYVYDFGDEWRHLVRLEAITERASPTSISYTLLEGENACPPEDCGGPYRYNELRATLADPTHPGHKELKAWAGARFDAAQYDPVKIQSALTKLLPTAKASKKSPTSSSKLKRY